jgi:hypothetical protein
MNKKITWLLLIVIVFLTVCFLWREKLSISKTINHEKFNAYFSSLGAIGTAFSLFLIYRQIVLQSEANRLAHAPMVGISENLEFALEIVDTSVLDKQRKQFRVAANYKTEEHSDLNKYHSSKLELFNTGNGAAVDVKLETYYRDELFQFFHYGSYRPDFHYITETKDVLHARERIEIDIVPYCNWLIKDFDLSEIDLTMVKQGGNHWSSYTPRKALYFKLSYTDMENKKFEKYYWISGTIGFVHPEKYYYEVSFHKADEAEVNKDLDRQQKAKDWGHR